VIDVTAEEIATALASIEAIGEALRRAHDMVGAEPPDHERERTFVAGIAASIASHAPFETDLVIAEVTEAEILRALHLLTFASLAPVGSA
jgi:hypothetical protein